MLITQPNIINLDKDTSRWETIISKCKDLNIKCNRFPAVYGKKLEKSEIDKLSNVFAKYFILSYSMVGCALSHIRLMEQEYLKYKELKEKNKINLDLDEIWIQIWEDDTLIEKDYHSKMLELKNNLEWTRKYKKDTYQNIDMIKLHTMVKDLSTTFPASILFKKTSSLKLKNLELSSYKHSPFTNSLIVKCSSIPKLLEHFKKYKIIYHVDWQQSYISNFNIWYLSHEINPPNFIELDSNNLNGTYPKFIIHFTNYVLKKLNINTDNIIWFSFLQPVLNINFKYKINCLIILYLFVVSLLTILLKCFNIPNFNIILKIFLLIWFLEIILTYK